MWLGVPEPMARSDGWFALISASGLNTTLLSLLSALTTCFNTAKGSLESTSLLRCTSSEHFM